MTAKPKFKFSKMLTDPAEIQPIRDYLDAHQAEAMRRAAEGKALDDRFQDLVEHLRQRHKIPRGLAVLIDPNHLMEHGVVFVHSQETDVVEVEDSIGRTVQ